MDDRQCLGAIPGITKITDTGDKNFKELQLTPWGVAKEQIDMLPEEIFNPQSMFVDICYKNEVYLQAIRERLMKSRYMNVPGLDNLENRLIYITRMQLYAICPLELTYKMCKAWFSSVKWPHAYIPDKHILKAYNMDGTSYRNPLNALDALRIFKNEPEANRSKLTEQSLYEFKAQELYEFMIDTVNMRENKMKFDVVVGNPPYNNDMYLDFVTKSHALASKYTCMITPAKWQAKGGDKNEAFRRDIVPYMEKIVYYPCVTDCFNITAAGGVTEYMLGKHVIQNVELKVKSKTTESFHGNHIIMLDRQAERKTYYGDWVEKLVNKCQSNNCLGKQIFIDKHEKGNYMVVSSHLLDDKQHSNCFGGYILTPVTVEEQGCIGKNKYEMYCGSKDACTSFKSYVDCKLVRFLVALGVCASSVKNFETWRFVPAPDAFDHIFTDAELYKKYNLTSDEIAVIESVIKERK